MNHFKVKNLVLILMLITYVIAFPQKGLRKISKEQKLYEFSVVWKELSYNFANMDNCPGLNIDSLYRAYIPVVENTKNDFEYYKSMQKFLACFHNGHTRCEMPDAWWNYLALPFLITTCSDGKLLIDNLGSHYSKKITIGDEILKIDNIPAMEYINRFGSSYVSTSNADDTRMKYSMFNPNLNTLITYAPTSYKKKIKLEVKTSNGIKRVQIPYDIEMQPSPRDTARQATRTYVKKQAPVIKEDNLLLIDSVNSCAYLRFTRCDKEFDVFFQKNYDVIKKYDNLIIDIADNGGGDGNAVTDAICHLSNIDSIQWNKNKTRVNNAYYKARASVCLYYQEGEVSPNEKEQYYPFFYNTAFSDVPFPAFANPVSPANRYKGSIYVITSSFTASAAESFIVSLTKNPKTIVLGKKTAGATAQPLSVRLPSGMEIRINTCKNYDYKGRDVSSGITPDYEYDFSDIYKTGNPNDWFKKFEEQIKKLSEAKK